MALYIYPAACTPGSLAAQIRGATGPHRGGQAGAGGHGRQDHRRRGYPFGEYDVLGLMEAPDDTTAASVALAGSAGGATRAAKTTRLLSGQEWIESVRKAQGSQYRPAR